MGESRDDILYRAKLAEEAERYNDMMTEMKTAVLMNAQLTYEERNLLTLAYKNASQALRKSLRSIDEEKEELHQPSKSNVIKAYRGKVQQELRELCLEIIELLDVHLIDKAQNPEVNVFYLKMKGDYYRYLAEFISDDSREDYIWIGADAYLTGMYISKELETTHSYRLGIALNYSVLLHDIMNDREEACIIAHTAYDDAIKHLDELAGEDHKATAQLLQLLQENYEKWEAI